MQTKVVKVNPDSPEPYLIKEAVDILKRGGLVAFPTETVYGIAAVASDSKAIDRLYNIKKRPRTKPFTLHIQDLKALDELGIVLSERASRIVNKFWPGPLTIIAFNKNKEKIGVRMPDNKIAQLLIKEAGVPIVAPSANISGGPAPSSSEEVLSGIPDSLDMVLDGGKTQFGKESTVLDTTVAPFQIVRDGALSRKELFSDFSILFVCTGNTCRSVMAKALLCKFLREASLLDKVEVDSAGTSAFFGIRAMPNTIEVLKEEGEDVSLHIGKPVTVDLLRKADFIFVMERAHRNIILGVMPETSKKLRLLKEGEDIPDPIGKDLAEYKRVLYIIKGEIENIFLELFNREKVK